MKRLIYILYMVVGSLHASADDLALRLGAADYRIDSTEVGTLGLNFDALAFFKDNEFDSDVVRGYSLPGFRVQPRLTYTPLPQVRLEAGMHATVYEGANKYPSYVFHDIAHWKGDQHQHGAHALPFFRATASLGPDAAQDAAAPTQSRRSQTTVVVGNIYGGATHELLLPMYNPELLLTDDPEMGAQVLVDRRRWHSDVWINWQSYIFEEDTHQEAFTVGWTQRIELLQGPTRLYVPVQLVVQHRGGEQDLPELSLGVQTLANAAAGLACEWRPTQRAAVTAVTAEACGLAAYQQSGHLWPFDTGGAAWIAAGVEIRRDLHVKAGLLHAPSQFCSLYGSPFFGTISLKHEGETFGSATTGYWAVDYGKSFTSNTTRNGRHRICSGTYTLGAKADGYVARGRTPFSFGIYFRACPNFVLKRLVR